jgi:hypothetical protein
VRFESPIPLNVANLVKVSKSAGASASSLAVCRDKNGGLVIWGLVDQQGRRSAYIRKETETGAELPGVVHISIVGTGALEVYRDYSMLGALRQGRLTFGYSEVLERDGPIRDALIPTILKCVTRARSQVERPPSKTATTGPPPSPEIGSAHSSESF